MFYSCQTASYTSSATFTHCVNRRKLASLFLKMNKPKGIFGTFRPSFTTQSKMIPNVSVNVKSSCYS